MRETTREPTDRPAEAADPASPDVATQQPALEPPSSLRDRIHRAQDRRPLTDTEWTDHVADVSVQLDKAQTEGLATDHRYTTDPDRTRWTRDRRHVHEQIVDHLYRAAADVPNEHKAIIAGGLPGAGKTTVLESHAGIDRSQYLTINPDVIKEELAKRGLVPEVRGLSPMEASDLVHEESSYVAQQLALRARDDGKNIIWDVTMSSRASAESRIDDLRSAGYKSIEGIFVDIPLKVSAARADSRHRQDHDKYLSGDGLGGRYVPPDVIFGQADSDWGSKNRRTFEELKPSLDQWSLFDNGVDHRDPILSDTSSPQASRSELND